MDSKLQLDALIEEYRKINRLIILYGTGGVLAAVVAWFALFVSLKGDPILALILAGFSLVASLRFNAAEAEKFGLLRQCCHDLRKLIGHESLFRHELGEYNKKFRRVADGVFFVSTLAALILAVVFALGRL